MAAAAGFIIHSVDAASFQPPSQAPPGGNIPLTIWNRIATTARQTSAAIDIDAGTLTVGIPNIIYGNMAAGSPAASNHILLQTASADRFKVTRDGNMTITGMSTLGSASLDLTGTQNLLYGNIDGTPVPPSTTSLLLLQKASSQVFRVDTEGRVSAGSAATVLAAAQNLLYGNVDTTSTGSLMLLQTESADRFRVDKNGNVTAAGKVKANSCIGKTFVGLTVTTWPGNVGSYYAADNKCALDFPAVAGPPALPAAHVCRVEEILESISCSVPGDPIRGQGIDVNFAWLNGGPPGFTANANDCIGWTSNASSAYGRVWVFNDTTGGRGTQTTCNTAGLKFACCR